MDIYFPTRAVRPRSRRDAIATAHPENIRLHSVSSDGGVHVLDFGIAARRWRAQTTAAGQVKGKLPYMAPEMLRGLPGDWRADIYAAGVVLWEVLAGRGLFRANRKAASRDIDLARRILTGRVEPPSTYSCRWRRLAGGRRVGRHVPSGSVVSRIEGTIRSAVCNARFDEPVPFADTTSGLLCCDKGGSMRRWKPRTKRCGTSKRKAHPASPPGASSTSPRSIRPPGGCSTRSKSRPSNP